MTTGLSLAVRLALRELRGGTRGLRILIICLAIGVAAIAGVGTISSSITAGIAADGRALLGGDVELRLNNRVASGAELAYLRDNVLRLSQMTEMRAMVRPATARDLRSLVEMKAVDPLYPMVGSLGLEPIGDLSDFLAKRDGIWGAVAAPALIRKLRLTIGDRVQLGDTIFELRAALTFEPDEVVSIFALGPRMMIADSALPDTNLVQPGSQFHYHYRVILPTVDAIESWKAKIGEALPHAGWRIRGHDEAAPGVRRFIENMSLFLTFAGLTALLVGGIGVANAVSAYIDGKTATIATLKCLGAPARLVFQIYLFQVIGLALFSICIGLTVGAVAPILAILALTDMLPVVPRVGIYPLSLFLGAAFGLLTALTFSLWPLARTTEVPAARLYRDIVTANLARRRIIAITAVALCATALAALTILTSEDKGFASWFVGGSALVLVILRGAGAATVYLARHVKLPRRPELRLAVANLYRPGSSTVSIIISLGLGLTVLVAVSLIQGNLSRQVSERLPEHAPAFFFIDIQPDQVADFDSAVLAVPGVGKMRRVPTLRGRIVAIKHIPVDKAVIESSVRWAVRGDRVLTYAGSEPEESHMVSGAWWPADYSGPPLISLDANIAKGFGVGIGNALTINVLGRDIEVTVANLREIDWRSLRFDFTIIFSPGILEAAPHTHIAAVESPPGAEDAVERAGTETYSNITAVRVREALEAAARILETTSIAVRSTAGISILSGILVLGGAVAAGQRRRIYDAVIFKVLGATRRTMWLAFLAEYGILGLLTGLISAGVGTLTAWAVIVFLMGAEWVFLPTIVAKTVVTCIVVTIVVGFAGTWRALTRKSAPHLRNQ